MLAKQFNYSPILILTIIYLQNCLCMKRGQSFFGDGRSGDIGKRCVTEEGSNGECKPIFECDAFKNKDKSGNGGSNPTVCKKFLFFLIVCCPNSREIPRPVLSSSNLEKLSFSPCGVKQTRSKRETVKFLIVGGQISLKNDWPWMAAIFTRDRGIKILLCGGTVINDRYIVTAAHCFKTSATSKVSVGRFIVRLGEHDISDSNNEDEYEIQDIFVHEQYNPPSDYNDIALIKLKKKIQFKKSVQSICLPGMEEKTKTFEGKRAMVTGWGSTKFAGRESTKLRQVSVPIAKNSDCDKSYKRINIKSDYPDGIISSQMCAGFKFGKKDACQGDSGGPLMLVDGSSWKLVGIVSGGFQCARAGFPGVYTRVSYYLEWLATKMN